MKNSEFIKVLNKLTSFLVPIWENGKPPNKNKNWGPHFIFPNTTRPVSIGLAESYFLHNIVKSINTKNALEIGTGFGYSSWWIGHAMRDGLWLGSIDNYSEGGMRDQRKTFIDISSKTLGLDELIEYKIGQSPNDLSHLINNRILDIIFIDGYHYKDGPINDFISVIKYVHKDSIIIMHDVQEKYTTHKAIDYAKDNNWIVDNYLTSCGIALCYKNDKLKGSLLKAYHYSNNLTLF